MKIKFVITSIFSIALFVGVGSAQHVHVFDGNTFVPLTPISAISDKRSSVRPDY